MVNILLATDIHVRMYIYTKYYVVDTGMYDTGMCDLLPIAMLS